MLRCGREIMRQRLINQVYLLTIAMYLSHRPAGIGNQRYQLQQACNGSNADPSLRIPLLITEWSSSAGSELMNRQAFVLKLIGQQE